MKKIIVVLALAFCLPFISKSNDYLIITTSVTSETRTVKNFNAIKSSGAMKVIVRFGETESLRLEGDKNAIENIITEVKSSALEIHTKKTLEKHNYGKVTIYISAKRLNNLLLNGSGEIRVEPFKAENFSTMVNGSGAIRAEGIFSSFSGRVNGSGLIKFEGSANVANLNVNGSGKFDGSNFSTKTLSSRLNGSGSIISGAQTSLKANLTGSGSIRYIGNPSVHTTKIGSGKVSKLK